MDDTTNTTDTISAEAFPWTPIPKHLHRDPTLTLATKAVYIELRARANNETGECWPGIARIAKDACVSHMSVQRAIRTLETRGWITVTRRANGTNHYFVRNSPIPPAELSTAMNTSSTPQDSDTDDPMNTMFMEVCTPCSPGHEHHVQQTRTIELEPLNKNQLVASDNPPVHNSKRKQDLLWETLTGIFGDPATKSERGKYNSVHKKLREADVDHTELPELVAAYMTKYSKPNSPAPQPTAVTIAERVGELRHFIERGPIGSPNGTINDLVYQQRNAAVFARLEAEYGNTGGES